MHAAQRLGICEQLNTASSQRPLLNGWRTYCNLILSTWFLCSLLAVSIVMNVGIGLVVLLHVGQALASNISPETFHHDWVSWFSSVVPGWYLELCHNGFFSCSLHFIIHWSSYCLLVCSLHFYLVFLITCAERQKSLILKSTCTLCFYPENCGQIIIPLLSLSLSLSLSVCLIYIYIYTHTHTHTEWTLFCTGVFLKKSDWIGSAVGWWWWLYYKY